MKAVGKTVDGKPVVGGLFYYYDTLGIPMDMILSFCADNGCVPDFLGLFIDGRKTMAADHLIPLLVSATQDSYGFEFAREVENTLRKILDHDGARV